MRRYIDLICSVMCGATILLAIGDRASLQADILENQALENSATKPQTTQSSFSKKPSSRAMPINVQLNEPSYINGVMHTEKGGIITGPDLYLQARDITYTKKTGKSQQENTISARDQLYMVYKGEMYRGSSLFIDISTGKITITDGCTRNGDWFIGGKEICIQKNGPIIIHKAFISTSENERNDWSIESEELSLEPGKSLQGQNVSFRLGKIPLFWLPSYKKNLENASGQNRAPFTYRFRWGGGLGFMLEMSYDLPSFGRWKNKAIGEYSVKYGLGVGILSSYKGENDFERFDMLNFVAQGKHHSFNPKDTRYRLQGIYQNYYSDSNLNFVAMYDKLSDSGMQDEFADHPLTNARPGLTRATLWRESPDWIMSLNGRIKVNSFQTVKQELPLFTGVTRPVELGSSQWMLYNKFTTGYLNYSYANDSKHVHNFASTRSELSQQLYSTYTFSPLFLTPFLSYNLIHYSSSPQHEQRTNFIADIGVKLMTRYIRQDINSFQSLEPYTTFHMLTRPSVKPGNSYIFDLEDGFNRLNETQFGIRHSFIEKGKNPTLFQRKIHTNIYSQVLSGSQKLPPGLTKLWVDSLFDATEYSSFKLGSAYDLQHHVIDHFNLGTRYTISSSTAFYLEYRERSRYAWRKVDVNNFILDATRSSKSLLKSELSDPRQTIIATLYYAPATNLNIELKSVSGLHKRSNRRYHDFEMTVITLVKGALELKISYGIRSGTQQRWSISANLGARKESTSLGFHKIGQGNYTIW